MSTQNPTPAAQYKIDQFATDSASSMLDRLAQLDAVGLEPAPSAAACGALGCTVASRLYRTVVEGFPPRTLCRDHAVRLIRREVPDA